MLTKPKRINDDFDQSLRRLAAALPAEALPEALRARVLDSLPAPGPARPKPSRLRLAIAGLAACAAIGLTVTGLHSGLRPASAAGVRAAILRANTWHFVGWHLRDGHRVHWEVWGRRSPALYREQLGDEVYLDDGVRSTHILPPDPKNGRMRGVVLILPSRPQASPALADSGTDFLVGIGGDAAGFRPRGLAGDDETFEAKVKSFGYPANVEETTTLMVNKSTHLPVRYVVRRRESQPQGLPGLAFGSIHYHAQKSFREYIQAALTSTYNVSLPAAIAAIQPPVGYAMADATSVPPVLGTPEGSTCSQGGLTVQAEVLAQDAAGDLHLRFHGWLGGQPVRAQKTGLILDGARADGRYGTDDKGNAYVSVPTGQLGTGDGGVVLWLTPLEPLAPDATAPVALDLVAPFSVSRYERMDGRLVPITTERLTFHLRLPTEKSDSGLEAALRNITGPRQSLAVWAAEERASYYAGGEAEKGISADYKRAAYWWGRAARAATNNGDPSRAENDRKNAAALNKMQQRSDRP